MIPFHSILPELAQSEVRCVHVEEAINLSEAQVLPADEYVYLEYFCDDLACDCRRVLLEVISKKQPNKICASISYGWEKEKFYRKRTPWDPDEARGTVRGELDPLNEQSEYAEALLELFQKFVLDEPYRLRLRRHYRIFREELARRQQNPGTGGQQNENRAS